MMNWNKLLSPLRPGDQKAPSGSSLRNIYEQDYDRIIFSYPFRRLQDKTQVFPLPVQDFVHTRLTHSLEVASVGRSLGRMVGKTIFDRHPDISEASEFDIGTIVATASLAHDVGNPPFGHSGEDAISEFFQHHSLGKSIKTDVDDKQWADLTNYEGNAQGFRILSHQLFKGLKVSNSVLAAFSKYPRESLLSDPDKSRKSQKKYGFFQAEKTIFKEFAKTSGLIRLDPNELVWVRHPLAFLVEAADDICYSIIDLEDGTNLDLVSLDDSKDLLLPIIGDKYDYNKFRNIHDKREQIGLLRALAIAELIQQSVTAFLDVERNVLDGEFDQAITNIIPSTTHLSEILKLSINKIYRSDTVLEIEAAGFEVISGLLEAYLTAALDHVNNGSNTNSRNRSLFYLFPEWLQKDIDKGPGTYEIVLRVLDYINSMTDSFAIHTFRKLKGITIPGSLT